MQHDAPIDNGSSGGAVLSTDLKLAALNYAGNDYYCGAIPATKIREYLIKHYYQ